MNSDLSDLKAALDHADVECACIRLKDGRMMEIDCLARCRKENPTDPQS